MPTSSTSAESRLQGLRNKRHRDRFLTFSVVVLFLVLGIAAAFLLPQIPELGSPTASNNTARFLRELTPLPLRETWSWTTLYHWSMNLLSNKGGQAVLTTFGIATLGIVGAAAVAAPLSPLAARNLATENPLGLPTASPSRGRQLLWTTSRSLCRSLFILTRAIPEYVYAFLLLSLLGPNLWPMILALAIHNIGILGRLGTEIIENQNHDSAKALMITGCTRTSAVISAILPHGLNRVLVYFFYRWETCVREATVLGLVGIPSLGLLIDQARARLYYDEMLFFVLLGTALVFAGDVASNAIRAKLRNAS